MKMRYVFGALTAVILTNGCSAETPTSTAPALNTEEQKIGYIVGLNFGQNLKQNGMSKIDMKALEMGVQDALSGAKPRLTEDQARATMEGFQQKRNQERLASADKNMKAGQAFLATNKTKPGVVELPNGLQYKVITQGTGKKPADTDTVSVNYRGTLLNGEEFDSSYKRNEPATFQVGQVIKGWQEALKLMPAGSKYQVWIPSQLAYGPQGAGPSIGPNETLTFEIELLEVK